MSGQLLGCFRLLNFLWLIILLLKSKEACRDCGIGQAEKRNGNGSSDCHLAPQGDDGSACTLRLGEALPFGIDGLVAHLGRRGGAFDLRHQGIKFTALIIGKNLLPLCLAVTLGLFQHL